MEVIQFLVHEHPQEEEEVLVGIILAELQEVLGEVQLVIQVLLMLVQEIRLQLVHLKEILVEHLNQIEWVVVAVL
mgnify:CR=1 FL=1